MFKTQDTLRSPSASGTSPEGARAAEPAGKGRPTTPFKGVADGRPAARLEEGESIDLLGMVAAASHPALAADVDDRVLAVNRAAEEFLGLAGAELLDQIFHEVLTPRDVFGNRICTNRAFNEMVRCGDPIQAFDVDVRQASGRFARVKISVVVVLGPQPGRFRFVYYMIPRRRRRKSDEILDLLLKSRGHLNPSADPPPSRENGKVAQLTRREREILLRLVAGESTREMSESLEISPNTLRSHTQSILRKLGARSRVEAVSLALRQNLV